MINVEYVVRSDSKMSSLPVLIVHNRPYEEPWLLNVFDISALPKTAETLLEYILKEITYISDELRVVLIAWCTDASGESKKMRRLLRERLGWIITVDCWSHQVSSRNDV